MFEINKKILKYYFILFTLKMNLATQQKKKQIMSRLTSLYFEIIIYKYKLRSTDSQQNIPIIRAYDKIFITYSSLLYVQSIHKTSSAPLTDSTSATARVHCLKHKHTMLKTIYYT